MSYQLAEEKTSYAVPIAGEGLPSPLRSRFLFLREIHRDASGTLYEVEERNPNSLLPQPLALKLYPILKETSATGVALVRREALCLLSLGGKNSPKLYDYEIRESEGWGFVLSEFAPKGNLAAYIIERGGEIDFSEACQITTAILSAVISAHQLGILHRDIRAENVVRSEKGDWLLTGFKRAYTPDQRLPYWDSMIPRGSIDALAPETIRHGVSSPESDLYAVGLLFYRLLAGRSPFQGDSLLSIVEKMQREDWIPLQQFLEEVPVGLNELFRRALAEEPQRRFHDAQQFLTAVEVVRKNHTSDKVISVNALPEKKQGQFFRPQASAGFAGPLLSEEVEEEPELEDEEQIEHPTAVQVAPARRRLRRSTPERQRTYDRLIAGLFFTLVLAVVGFSAMLVSHEETPESIPDFDVGPSENFPKQSEASVEALQAEEGAAPAIIAAKQQDIPLSGPSAGKPGEAVYSIQMGSDFGSPSSVLIRVISPALEEPQRLVLSIDQSKWYLPILPTPRLGEYWAVFPTPKAAFQVSVFGASEENGRFNAYTVKTPCHLPKTLGAEREQLLTLVGRENFLLAAYEMARTEPSESSEFSVHRVKLPAISSFDQLSCVTSEAAASWTMPLTLKPGQDEQLHAKVVENLEKRLTRLLSGESLQALDKLAALYGLSDKNPVFSALPLPVDEFAYRLNLLVVTHAVYAN